MTLSIGIVVDDAIVVLENVERIMRTEGLGPYEASQKAMKEVSGALVAIVLVLSSVFIPVAFLGGIAGELYRQFAVTVSVSVMLSGFVALTLTPALCAIFLKPHDANAKRNFFFTKFNQGLAALTMRFSYDTPNCSNVSAAPDITSQSLIEPIITPTLTMVLFSVFTFDNRFVSIDKPPRHNLS